ncbi:MULTISPECIES: SH3 domain-containing protein [Streptomyces]|uniref:SH3 domain-containing protein n=2 Tax=Streptomyces TaxID=1883 RepID=A0A2U9P6W1_STRAS|nr:SH3 domain-containing protein [Streptomyces actuosus]AWT44708.1 SH3 domain-containing protein [Streptomyces actuosus]MBM4820079.1 SH3 domain-containing protein [Streptomyces actuosus]
MSVDRVEKRVEKSGDGAAEAAVTTTALRYYAVAPGVRLNVRSGPGTSYSIVRVLAEGAKVPIFCQTPGTWVTGPYGTSNVWDNIDDGEFVADAYIYTGTDGYVAPRCS